MAARPLPLNLARQARWKKGPGRVLQRRSILALAVIGFVLALLAALAGYRLLSTSDPGYIDPNDRQQVSLGKDIYAAHCAACHGARLEGQPEWRQRRADGRLPAPPHDVTGHTWHHPDEVLLSIIRHGMQPGVTAPEDYQSDMPVYDGVLSEQEMRAVLAFIKHAWPQEARLVQQRATEQYNER